MPSALHRIEPRLLSVPGLYGPAGEPSFDTMPALSMPLMAQLQPGGAQGLGLSPLLGLLAASLFSRNAQGPGMLQMGLPPVPEEKPNDEPVDVMPDTMKFGDAFAKARKMGLVEFTWRGKPYTTKLKE
jgi:hypothetical protein